MNLSIIILEIMSLYRFILTTENTNHRPQLEQTFIGSAGDPPGKAGIRWEKTGRYFKTTSRGERRWYSHRFDLVFLDCPEALRTIRINHHSDEIISTYLHI